MAYFAKYGRWHASRIAAGKLAGPGNLPPDYIDLDQLPPKERSILATLAKQSKPITAQKLARLCSYSFSSSFRQALANLKGAQKIWNTPDGWCLLPSGQTT